MLIFILFEDTLAAQKDRSFKHDAVKNFEEGKIVSNYELIPTILNGK